MHNDLDHMLRALRQAPVDHALEGLADDVGQRLAERRAAGVQTWGVRAVAIALVTLSGVAVSASGAAAAAADFSPFAVWSELAPWTLLGAAP